MKLLFNLTSIKNCFIKKSKVQSILCSFMLLVGFMLCAFTNTVQAQGSIEITGIVSDAKGPLPGANVVEKGTINGVTSDIDGKFMIKVASESSVLEFSSLGFANQDIIVGKKSVINVTLQEDIFTMDEVVVTGYGGTQKRSKLTNSIATVKKESLEVGLYSNPAQALSGAVAGLKVTQSSGNPGSTPSMVLRGGTNLDGSGSPLVMVDGQIRGGLSDINPDDIESMELLKDAGATALYGARASNGVLLITTKKGKSGTAQINFKAKVGLNYLNNPYDFMNGEDYLYWMRTAYKNASQIYKDSGGNWKGATTMASLTAVAPYGTGNLYWDPLNPSVALDGNRDSRAVWSPMILKDNNRFLLDKGWKKMTDPVFGDEILYTEFDYAKAAFDNPSLTQDYNISLSGGNDRGHYYASFGYYNADGLPIQTFYKRITASFNADYKIKPWLTSFTTVNFAEATWKDVTNTSEGNYFGRMLSAPPTMRGYNADGDILLGTNSGDGNPQKNIDAFMRDNNTDKFTLGQTFKVNVMEGLTLNASASYMFDDSYAESFNKDYLSSPNNWNRTRSSSANTGRTIRQTYVGTANYEKSFGEHNISGLVGVEYFDSFNKGFSAGGSGAPTDDFMDLGLTSTEENKRSIDSWHSRERILSFMGRVNYDYQAKYLLAFTFRQDGYSKLIDNRWGIFPGVSGGWVMSKEKFMEQFSSVLSFAKLRASYGVNGNVSGLGTYELQGSYGTSKYNGSVGYLLTGIPNPNLRWERSNTFEIGTDLGFLNNMFNVNITYYNRTTTDKFANIPLPGSSGITSIRSNNGTLRNQGIEIEASAKLLRNTKDWKWDINANIAYNKNTIVKLPNNGLENNRQNAYQVYDPNTKQLIWVGGYQEGQTPGALYAFRAEGIYKTEEDVKRIAANRIDKTTGNNGSNGRTLYGPEAWAALTDDQKKLAYPIQPGDVIWKDVNGDGTIDNYDMEYIGSTVPKFTGGFTTATSWKGLSLYMRFDYAIGHYQSDAIRPWFMGAMQGTFNSINDTKDTWTETNPNAPYPKYYWADQLSKRNYARNSSMFIYDASYLCFREISLSYQLPANLVAKAGLSGVQVSVTGQNLGYITSSKLYSPEIGGSTGGGYSLPRIIIFGTSITF